MKMNRAGFTLVELLAAMVILGILMGVAIPNVVGVVRKQRSKVYVEDAKRLAVRARTTFASDTNINKSNGVCMTMEYLDNGDFDEPPNGGVYLKKISYVRYYNSQYYVTLVECLECTKNEWVLTSTAKELRGIISKTYTELKNNDDPNSIVSTSGFGSSLSNCTTTYSNPNSTS